MKIKVSKKTAIRSVVVKRASVITASICGVIGLGALAANLTSATTTNIQALNVERNPVYEEYLQDVRNGNADKWSLVPSEYIPATIEENEGYGGGTDYSSLSRYSLLENNRGTKVKNQGGDGICWAMGISTVLESNLKTKGVEKEFSPKQLDYLHNETAFNNFVVNDLGGIAHNLGDGSNIIIATHLFANSNAPVYESDFMATMKRNDSTLDDSRYNSLSDYWNIAQVNQTISAISQTTYDGPDSESPYNKAMSHSDIISNSSKYAVSNITYKYRTFDIESIKQNVVEKGAVYVGTYGPESANCWDGNTDTIIDRGAEFCEGGHVMSIVGWDDNHSYYNPATGTTETGAFILQNSWGKASLFRDNITVDEAMAAFDTTGYSQAQLDDLRARLNNFFDRYDPYETVYLAYNTLAKTGTYSNTVNYAIFDGVEPLNAGEYIVGPLEETSGHGVSFGAAANELIYTYNATEESKIERISMINSLGYAVTVPLRFTFYLESGNSYKELGNVVYAAGTAGKKELTLSTPEIVNGTYKIKVAVTNASNGGLMGVNGLETSDFVTSLRLSTEGETPDPEPTTTYTLSFNLNGGSGSVASQTCTTASGASSCQVTIPNVTPTKTNYDFLGWSASAAATTATYQKNDAVTLSANTTLYAVWRQQTTPDPDDPIEPERPTGNITWINRSHAINGNENIVLSIDYPLANFQWLNIDGNEPPAGSYEATSGSTIITIKSEYLDTLAEGEHTIEAYFLFALDDATVSTTFVVAAEEEDGGDDIVVPDTDGGEDIKVPNTGSLNDGVDFASFGGIMAGATTAFVVAAIVYFAKNKNTFGKKVDFDKK